MIYRKESVSVTHANTQSRALVRVLVITLICMLSLGMTSCANGQQTAPDSNGSKANTVSFSLDSGFYQQQSITLEIESDADDADAHGAIYYTLDGSVPTMNSARYEKPLQLSDRTPEPSIVFAPEAIEAMEVARVTIIDDPELSKAQVVRAAYISEDGTCGPISTGTFFVGQNLSTHFGDAPVISIVTDPSNLLDYNSGILVRGRIYDEWVQTEEAGAILANEAQWDRIKGNFAQKGKDWERPAFIEIIEQSSPTCAFPCGIRLKGGYSRVFGQRSLNVYLRESYGQKLLDYPLIPTAINIQDQLITQYKSFCLRNGGNDTEYLKFKDAFLQSLVAERNFSTQESSIAVVFLNGEYMGPYNLQEKISEDSYANRYGIDPKNVVVIKEEELEEGEDGDFALYEHLLDYVHEDLADPEIWQHFKEAVDLDSMLDYYAVQIYIGNYDWSPYSNYILWRVREPTDDYSYADGRWRFSLYDTESSSAMYGIPQYQYDWDSFAQAVENHPLFKSALRNEEFRTLFLQRIEDVGNTDFSLERVQAALDRYASEWQPFMADYYRRFGDKSENWDKSLDRIRHYFQNRYNYIVPQVEAGLRDIASSVAPQ